MRVSPQRAIRGLSVGPNPASHDWLEAAGLCRRLSHPDDARSTLAEITANGTRVFDRAVDELNVKLFGAVALSDEELDQLVGLIGKIRAGAGDIVGVERGRD